MSEPATLNSEQRRALAALGNGSVMVAAGPGSGKTHTLAAAVQSVLGANRPGDVLCLTFTTKAAENLRRRLGPHPGLFAGTFHALAARIIETAEERPPIISGEEALAVLAGLRAGRASAGAGLRELLLLISRYKNGSLDTPEARRWAAAYGAELAARGLIDYDDLILRAIEHAAAGQSYDCIFVDEFQDTSPRQYELLQALAGPATKLFVIGDPKQSIYRFRGADGSVFRRLEADFAPRSIHLQHNYRSTAPIVAAANRIFPDQLPQRTVRRDAGTLRSIQTLDEYSEPAYILRVIEQALGGTEWHRTHHDRQQLEAAHFGDFAVLYRTRRQGELIAQKLRAAGLPLQCLGEDSPYASPPTQLLRITLETFDPDIPPALAVKEAAEALGLSGEDAVTQLENLASRFSGLKTFLAYLEALSEQAFFDPRADAIVLSTIHASKGLEFRHVFVAGCNQGLLPSRRAAGAEALDEEKRLFYVAVTRARDSLLLLHTRRYGGRASEPSAFLDLLAIPSATDEQLATVEQRRQRTRQKRAQQRLL